MQLFQELFTRKLKGEKSGKGFKGKKFDVLFYTKLGSKVHFYLSYLSYDFFSLYLMSYERSVPLLYTFIQTINTSQLQ